MKQYTKPLFSLSILLCLAMACIPVQQAPLIKTYEIQEGQPKRKKDIKKNTQFVFSYYESMFDLFEFLNSKYPKAYSVKKGLAVVEQPFFDVATPFKFRFYFLKNRDVNVDLISLFSKKKTINNSNDIDDYDTMRYGDYKHYLHITVVDENGIDMLSKQSAYRGRLVTYLNNLRGEYIHFTKEKKLLLNQ